jgi:hypothetical protein
MKKGFLPLLLTLSSFITFAQDFNSKSPVFSAEQFPVFPKCENVQSKELEHCFYNEVRDFVFQNFVVPENFVQNNFKGNIKVLFEVDINGDFKVIYVNAVDDALIQETKRVFAKFPKIKPSTYSGKPTFSK